MVKTESFKKVEITTQKELYNWLTDNYTQQEGVWLVTFKKTVINKYVSRDAVLDELLCFGWIDGIRRKLDEERTMQLITPRRVQHWSKTYKDRAAKLITEGKMQAPGRACIAESKKSGSWTFMDDVDALIIPPDLKKALTNKPDAEHFFNTINDSSKRFVLRWLKLTKTDKTRKSRISQLVELSQQQKKLPGS